jgi:cytochrome c oxidase assembly protein subunit 15
MEIKNGLNWLLALVAFQILLGILTILLHVEIAIAMAHQIGALSLFALTLFFIHRLRAADNTNPIVVHQPVAATSPSHSI